MNVNVACNNETILILFFNNSSNHSQTHLCICELLTFHVNLDLLYIVRHAFTTTVTIGLMFLLCEIVYSVCQNLTYIQLGRNLCMFTSPGQVCDVLTDHQVIYMMHNRPLVGLCDAYLIIGGVI